MMSRKKVNQKPEMLIKTRHFKLEEESCGKTMRKKTSDSRNDFLYFSRNREQQKNQ